MSIVRVNKDARYFTASNEPFNDKRLHWETRGLLAYLLSKPNNWQVRLSDLEKQGPAGSHKIRKMLKDAQIHGYVNRTRHIKEDHTFYWITEIYESPGLNPNPQPSGGFSTSGFSTSGFSTRGKLPDIVSTDGINTDGIATTRETAPNIFEVYEENIGALTPLIADALTDAEQTYSPTWIADAIALAVTNNKRNWKYCEAILKRWKVEGKDDGSNPKKEPKGKTKNQGETPLEKYIKEQEQSDGN